MNPRYSVLLLAPALFAADLVTVVSHTVERKAQLPGEFQPYQQVDLYARVSGFVEQIHVDVGSPVKKGDRLAQLSAPELGAQRVAAEARVHAVEAQRAEAEAKVAAAESTYERLKSAAATPGAVSGNEVIQAEKSLDAVRAQVKAIDASAAAARAAVASYRDMEAYLVITAPFDGVITERHVHPGALVGPGAGRAMFHLEQNSRLRLIVAVPEALVGGLPRGARVTFTLPAFPGESFSGVVARVPNTMDPKTRSMAVELDVANPRQALAPGMYPTVTWPVRSPHPSLLVPLTSVVTTTERTFVIRVRNGIAEWVNVSKGAPSGELVEVFGPLTAGDSIVKRATDEIRPGAAVK